MQPNAWRSFAELCLAATRRFREERGLQTASALTYTTLLALVPLLTVAFTIATAFPVFHEAMDGLRGFLKARLLPEAAGAEMIGERIASFTRNAGRLRAIGIGFLAVTALMLMFTIDGSLNRLFRVAQQRTLLRRLLMYSTVMAFGPLLIGASLSMTSFALGASFGWLDLSWAADVALGLLPFVSTSVALTLLYAVVPNCRVPLRHALIGGVLACVALELAKRGFALFLKQFPTYSLIYGAFAIVPIFLLWLYLSWAVVLAGAALTATLPKGEKK